MSRAGWLGTALLGAALLGGAWWVDPTLGRLNLAFMKLGPLAFGGGFAMVPLIQQEVVGRLGWLSTGEFVDGIALGQVTPGPVVITATFVGYKVRGWLGAVTATISVFYPSFLILVATMHHFDRIKRLQVVQAMIKGVLAAFVGLLAYTLWQFARAALVDWTTVGLAIGAFVALRLRVDTLAIVGVASILSLVLF
jgi:chromate transporter